MRAQQLQDTGGVAERMPLYRFLAPRYWLLWAGIIVMRVLVLLPYPALLMLGRGLGRCLYLLVPHRRRVAAANLRICFPGMTPEERQQLLVRHFHSLGMAVFDFALAWWASDRRIAGLVQMEGVENLAAALAGGRGAIVLSGHFPATEVTGRALQQKMGITMAGIYRPSRNRLVNEMLLRSRGRAVAIQIPKAGMRQLIRTLARGHPVWYAPDQAYTGRFSALVPFFGEPAMTNCALTQLASMSRSPVVPYLPRRRADGSGYVLTILPALADFPTGDAAADALRVNRLLEAQIRRAPDQYYWVHRRFKARPGLPDPYAAPDAARS